MVRSGTRPSWSSRRAGWAPRPDPDLGAGLLAASIRHIGTAQWAAGEGDFTGAYQLAYAALRNAAAALLAVQGLRATSQEVTSPFQDADQAQFAGTGSPFRSLPWIRRNRNSFEYPVSEDAGPDHDDVGDAMKVAQPQFLSLVG